MDKISLIIPAKNEMESLEEVLSEIEDNPYVDEKILIVDSIKDNSIPIAKKFNCKIIIQKKRGYGAAIIEGFENAKNEFGCIFNADHSFDPKYFEQLIDISKNRSPEYAKIFLGCAVWDQGQLDNEILENSWIITNSNKDLIFNNHLEFSLWKKCLKNMGVDPSKLVSYSGSA